MKYFLYLILAFSIITTSCGKDENNERADIDDGIITEYLSANNLTATKHESGLYYIVLKEGTGGSPNLQHTVVVDYKGYLTDGTVFDESDNAVELHLAQLIVGWQIGLNIMKSGGKSKMFIPSGLGYGNKQVVDIPANSVLIFDIELVEFY